MRVLWLMEPAREARLSIQSARAAHGSAGSTLFVWRSSRIRSGFNSALMMQPQATAQRFGALRVNYRKCLLFYGTMVLSRRWEARNDRSQQLGHPLSAEMPRLRNRASAIGNAGSSPGRSVGIYASRRAKSHDLDDRTDDFQQPSSPHPRLARSFVMC